nr:MAG TPA: RECOMBINATION ENDONUCLEASE VII [Caudoviricetes sp.]
MTLNRKKIYGITNGRCFYCGCDLDANNFHIDHYLAQRKNGKQHNNLVPACPDCNMSKGTLSVEEFRKKLSELLAKNHQGRMISKYYKIADKPIRFYFEEVQDGDIQNRINDILDRQKSY